MNFEIPTKTPVTVVSLLPSGTANLLDLGLGDRLVGVTDYCHFPEVEKAHVQRIGGPKSVDLQKVIELRPDLVLANQEENDRNQVMDLIAAGLPVWVSFPKTVADSIQELWKLVEIFRLDSTREVVLWLEKAVEWQQLATYDQPRKKCFCPIWQGECKGVPYWMTFNRDTYCDSLIDLVGGENVFGDRERKYPLEAELGLEKAQETGDRDRRYPAVRAEDVIDRNPDLILLPDDPYVFQDQDVESMKSLFAETNAAKSGSIYKVDGSLITWPGTRIGKAIAELPQYF